MTVSTMREGEEGVGGVLGRVMYTREWEAGGREEGGREKENGGMVPSFIHWQASKNILSHFVCGGK